MAAAYLLSVLAAIFCMLLIDRRFKLFFWKNPWAAGLVCAAGTAFFLVWDAAGIGAGIFIRGQSQYMLGIELAPQMPLEEPVFLFFLVLCTMVVYTGALRLLERSRARRVRAKNGEGAA